MRCISFLPCSSNRHTSIFVAWAENTAKFVPKPSQVAPRGSGDPSLRRFSLIAITVQARGCAITKGPSLNPSDKRLAVRTEDHPLSYGTFEGTIPRGEYGGGTVMMWDQGTWEPKGDPQAGLAKGHLAFTLRGKRLKGGWNLV